MHSAIGTGIVDDDRSLFVADEGEAGALLVGPYVAFAPGSFAAVFTFEAYRVEKVAALPPDTVVAVLDVVLGEEGTEIGRRELCAGELPRTGEQVHFAVEFALDGTAFAGRPASSAPAPRPLRWPGRSTSSIRRRPRRPRTVPRSARRARR